MSDEALLSDLCKICNDATPKYCCPRCNTKTCSLACYKRHQTWSQCSGKRDPGAYVKRSQLATPAGIDHDFNFLSGIERAFETVDRDVVGRGIGVESSGGGGKRRWNGPTKGSNLQRGLAASGAIIRKAPVGMSRQKSNKTGYNAKNRCLVWTVEWIDFDGKRKTGQCRENLSLEVLHLNLFSEHHRLKKRQKLSEDDDRDGAYDDERARKVIKVDESAEDDETETNQLEKATEIYQKMIVESKAQHDALNNSPQEELQSIVEIYDPGSNPQELLNQQSSDGEPQSLPPAPTDEVISTLVTLATSPTITAETEAQKIPLSSDSVIDMTAEQQTSLNAETSPLPLHENVSESRNPAASENAENSTLPAEQKIIVSTAPQAVACKNIQISSQEDVDNNAPLPPQETTNNILPPPTTQAMSPPTPSPFHYYLHKPQTTSTLPVLIPLTPTSTLQTCLQTRLVLEYPTIYVLKQAPSELPQDYLLEAEYHKQEKKMIEELDQDEKEYGIGEDVAAGNTVKDAADDGGEVEEARVLESLKRDLMDVGGITGG